MRTASELSYLELVNGAEPDPNQRLGVNKVNSLSFSDVWHDQLEHLLLH